jgi:hypothetical protein
MSLVHFICPKKYVTLAPRAPNKAKKVASDKARFFLRSLLFNTRAEEVPYVISCDGLLLSLSSN